MQSGLTVVREPDPVALLDEQRRHHIGERAIVFDQQHPWCGGGWNRHVIQPAIKTPTGTLAAK